MNRIRQTKEHQPAGDSIPALAASVWVTLVNYSISLISASLMANPCINSCPTSQVLLKMKEILPLAWTRCSINSVLLPEQVPYQVPSRRRQRLPAEVRTGEGAGHLCKWTKHNGEVVLGCPTVCWGPGKCGCSLSRQGRLWGCPFPPKALGCGRTLGNPAVSGALTSPAADSP